MVGIKGNGLISEAGGIVTTSVKKGGKAIAGEAGKFAKEAHEQITATKKPPPPKVELDGEKKREQEQTRIKQLQANFRKITVWQQAERERIQKERERLAQIREEPLVGEEKEEKKKSPPLNAIDWFRKIGKKARGWLFARKKGERKPAGFRG